MPCLQASSAAGSRRCATGDLRGLRTSSYKKRVVVATFVDDEAQRVTILGVFYGGQDYDAILSGSDNA